MKYIKLILRWAVFLPVFLISYPLYTFLGWITDEKDILPPVREAIRYLNTGK